jgi:hypothetical protein
VSLNPRRTGLGAAWPALALPPDPPMNMPTPYPIAIAAATVRAPHATGTKLLRFLPHM